MFRTSCCIIWAAMCLTRWVSLAAALLLAGRAAAQTNVCDWAEFDDPVAEGDFVPTASWKVAPPCITTTAYFEVATLLVENASGGIATNALVTITTDADAVIVDAWLTSTNGTVRWKANGDPILVQFPRMPTGEVAQVHIRARNKDWTLVKKTPRGDWGWAAGAWPACEHTGWTEYAPGVMHKQIWARDLFWALEERCEAVHTNGSAAIWGALRPTWWTEAGVTNRVARYEVATQDGFDLEEPGNGSFLEAAKRLCALLAEHYLDTEQIDPEALPESWHDFHVEHGARVDVAVQTNAFTAWRWGCPAEDHSGTYIAFDQVRLATNTVDWTYTSLPEALSLPRQLFGITPYRFPEGLCNPEGNPLAAAWIYQTGAVTGVCNWATFSPPTVEEGPIPECDWSPGFAPGCISNGLLRTAAILLENPGTNDAIGVELRIDIDAELEVAQVSSSLNSAAAQWSEAPGSPVAVRLPVLPAGEQESILVHVRSRRLAGPESGRTFYWWDFGWDAMRKAIRELKTVKGPHDSRSPILVDWRWQGEGDNVFGSTATSEKSQVYVGGAATTLLADGSYADARDAALADMGGFRSESAPPRYRYRHEFFGDKVPAAGVTNIVNCQWGVEWGGFANQARLVRQISWPPTNVTAVVHCLVDVATREDEEREVWSTELVGSHTFASPGTNEYVFAQILGDGAVDLDHAPGDPSAAKGQPVLGEGEFPDDSPEGLAERRGNYFLREKEWANLFLVIEYDWQLP